MSLLLCHLVNEMHDDSVKMQFGTEHSESN